MPIAVASPGDLDPTFSRDGKVRVHTKHIDEANDMVLDSKGRIVLVGTIGINDGRRFDVIRLTRDGSLDRAFGRDGRRTIDFGGNWAAASAVAIQPDGKIVIVGLVDDDPPQFMAVARLLPNGRLDAAFSGDGRKRIDFRYTLYDGATAVSITDGGRILVGGSAGDRGALVRLRPGGRLDHAFGTRGRVVTKPDGSHFGALALQGNGRILGATERLVRYLADGSPDFSFGDQGVALDPAGPQTWGCTDIAVQKDGKIVCSSAFINDDPSSDSWDAAVLRWRLNGVPDSGFGTDGVVVTGVEPSPGPQQAGSTEEALSVVVQPDGKIITAGWTYSITPGPHDGHSFLVIRYLASGEPDSSFGEGGIVRTQFTGWIDRADTVALQRDGRIVVGGTALDSDMAVARYLP